MAIIGIIADQTQRLPEQYDENLDTSISYSLQYSVQSMDRMFNTIRIAFEIPFEHEVRGHPPISDQHLFPSSVEFITKIIEISNTIIVEFSPTVLPRFRETAETITLSGSVPWLLDGLGKPDMEIDTSNVILFETHLHILVCTWTHTEVQFIIIFDLGIKDELVCERNHLVNLRVQGILCAHDYSISCYCQKLFYLVAWVEQLCQEVWIVIDWHLLVNLDVPWINNILT